MPELGTLAQKWLPPETCDQEPGEGKAESQDKHQQLSPGARTLRAWLWMTLHSPAPGSSVLPHLPLPRDTVDGMGPREAGDQGRDTSGRASNSEPRYKMKSNNNNKMTSNARKAQAAVLGALGDGARVEACRNVQSRRSLANARREVSCPIDGDTVSRRRSRSWGVTAPMGCGDRPAISLAFPAQP